MLNDRRKDLPSPRAITSPAMAATAGRVRGMTLVELMFGLGLLAVAAFAVGAALTIQADVTGRVADDDHVFLPAHICLERIRSELKSAVQTPPGVTAEPFYSVSATAVTFRPAVGVVEESDPAYATLAAEGRVSSNGVVYAPYVKVISYDAETRRVTLESAGTLPSGMPATEVLASDVESFAFFDGESQAKPPADPDDDTWVLGVRMEVSRSSAEPGTRGAVVRSNRGDVVLTSKVLMQPETLVNAKSKPATGP